MRRTLILKINPTHPSLYKLKVAAKIVLRRGVIIYPTETVYGIGGNPLDPIVVKEVFTLKRRPRKPLPVLVYNISVAEKLAYLTEDFYRLAEAFWPGSLSLVVWKRPIVPPELTAYTDTIALRESGHPIVKGILKFCGGAIIGTSANVSGEKPPKTFTEAIKPFYGRVNVAIDSGPSEHGIPSTILDLTKDPPVILREGPVSKHDIERVLNKRVIVKR